MEEKPMAQMPVEVIEIGNIPSSAMTQALDLANSLQNEFFFDRLAKADAAQFQSRLFSRVHAPDFLNEMETLRSTIKGYHPFLIAFIDAEMDGKTLTNLFASNKSERGLGVVSIANVPDLIVPSDRLPAYFLYYIAHQTLGFIAPHHKNHDDTRSCVFDRKIRKIDLLSSMRARALCDECRRSLLGVNMLSPGQLAAADNFIALQVQSYSERITKLVMVLRCDYS